MKYENDFCFSFEVIENDVNIQNNAMINVFEGLFSMDRRKGNIHSCGLITTSVRDLLSPFFGVDFSGLSLFSIYYRIAFICCCSS